MTSQITYAQHIIAIARLKPPYNRHQLAGNKKNCGSWKKYPWQ